MMESEFIALDKATEEVEWLRQFLEDIPEWSKLVSVITIYCNSQSTIGRAQNNRYKGMSRHICHIHNTTRQLPLSGVVAIDYVESKDNVTKS